VLLLMKGRLADLDVAVSVTSQTRSNSRTLTPSPPSVPVIRSLVDRLLESQGPALGARRLGRLVGKAPAGFGQALLMGYPKHWGHRPRAGPGERLDCAKDLAPAPGRSRQRQRRLCDNDDERSHPVYHARAKRLTDDGHGKAGDPER
jgi:hypothetical protein